jgi:hypothetical protein
MLRDGLGHSGGPAHCGGKEEEGGGRVAVVAGREREGQRNEPKCLFHFLFPFSIS